MIGCALEVGPPPLGSANSASKGETISRWWGKSLCKDVSAHVYNYVCVCIYIYIYEKYSNGQPTNKKILNTKSTLELSVK